MFPHKPLDIFPSERGCSEGLDAFRFFLNNVVIIYYISVIEPYKERYDIITILVKSGTTSFYKLGSLAHRYFLPCHLFGACLYFTLHVTFVTAG